mmetsp:Transcript_29140/g.47837  ORF Transcript_29140/g.47837 Transcript_29140/m.47837 type:complete len:233 (+) Transcript_29140:75-773(+)
MKRSWASHTLQLFLLIFSMLVPLKDAFQFSTKPPMENKKRYSSSLKMVASWKNGTTNRRTFVFQGAAGVFAGSLFSQNIAVFALDPTEKRKVLQSFAGQIKKFSESISEEPQLALLPAIRQSLDLKPLITLTSQYVETLGSFEVTETRKLTDKILRAMNRDMLQMEDLARPVPADASGKQRVKILKEPLQRFEQNFRALAIALDPEGQEQADTLFTKKPLFQLCPNGYLLCD